MNLSSMLLNNVITLFGLKIPSITMIFSGIVLGLIIITSVITGVVSKKFKDRRKAEEVKKVAPTVQAKASNDDGVYALNRHSEEIAKSEGRAVSEEIASDEHIEDEEELVDDNGVQEDEHLEEDDFLVEEESESVDENIDKILAELSNEQDVLDENEYETEEFSDDDMDEYFASRARMAREKADAESEIDIDIDEPEEVEEIAEEVEEVTEEVEEVTEEIEEESETEEIAEEIEEESETEEIVTELDEDSDLIIPTEEHTTDDEIVFIADPEPETITPVVEEVEEESEPEEAVEPEMSEEERRKEQERIAEEARRQADEEYQEQLRLAEEKHQEEMRLAEEERLRAEREHQEQLRLAEEEAQRQRAELEAQREKERAELEAQKEREKAELEAQKEREKAELEERIKRMEEEKQAQLAQLSEDSRRIEDRLSATEAMVAMLEAHNLTKDAETESEEIPPEHIEDLDDEEPEDEELSIKASKYKRSFTSKLIQSEDDVKKYYSELRNELLSYNKMRCSSAWQGDTYIAGRKTLAKILMGGKTLCLYLSLNPAEFNPNTYHHKDKSASKKYAQTPFQMRIKSDLSMRRAISLIVVMMSDNELEKNPKYARKDFESNLGYRDDEALLAEGLIKLNINAIEVVDKTLDEQDYEQERAEQEKMPKNYREVKLVKKAQVGNISQEDVGKINKTKKVEQVEVSPNASKTGKFAVVEEDGDYKFVLYAPDGKSIFESKTFKTHQGARNAIDSFRIAIADPQNSSLGMLEGEYIYTIKYTTTFISAPFKTKVSASRSLNLIKRTSAVANVEE